MDLRVDDAAEPIKEIRRLVDVHRAYEHMNEGDEKLALNDVDAAMKEYAAAAKMLPNNVEVKYWAAITMITAGREKEAMPYFREVFAKDRSWVEVTKRLPRSGLLPDDPGLMEKILGAAPKKR